MTATALSLAFLAGAVVGAALGRCWAETRRAQHDMHRTWRARTRYRRRPRRRTRR